MIRELYSLDAGQVLRLVILHKDVPCQSNSAVAHDVAVLYLVEHVAGGGLAVCCGCASVALWSFPRCSSVNFTSGWLRRRLFCFSLEPVKKGR